MRTGTPTPTHPARAHSLPWRASFTATLSAGMASATCSQFTFGVLAPFLVGDFDISRSQLGLLTTCFFVVGGVLSLLSGGPVDARGGRRIFNLSMATVGAALCWMALAPGFPWMLIGAALAGAALSSSNPTTNKLIAEHLPQGERGVVMGVKQAGVQVGAFLIGILLPTIARAWGWRGAMVAVLVLPLAALVGSFVVVPTDHSTSATADRKVEPVSPELKSTVKWMAAYGFFMGASLAVVGAYLPLYAEESVGLSVETAGAIAALMGFVGILSRVAWGWGTERLGRFRVPLVVMAVGAAFATVLVIAADEVGGILLWAAAVLFGITAVTWNSVGMLAILSEVEPHEAGRASGYVLSGFYAGFVVTPILFGYSVDTSGEYTLGWSAVALLFLCAAAVALAWHFRRRRA